MNMAVSKSIGAEEDVPRHKSRNRGGAKGPMGKSQGSENAKRGNQAPENECRWAGENCGRSKKAVSEGKSAWEEYAPGENLETK